jgi:hypothetical protein
MAASLRFVFGIEAEVHQRIVALAGLHPHIAPVAPVSARRAAPRNEFLPPERHTAVAAVACLYPNFGFVNKHSNKKAPA